MSTTIDTSVAHYETMHTDAPFVLYRLLFGDTIEFASVFYRNAMIDAKLFSKRVIITDSRSFTLGKNDIFLQFLAAQPGTTILDLADMKRDSSVCCFILRNIVHVPIILQKVVEELIEKSLREKDWYQVSANLKALLFMFETNFIVADFECEFIDSPFDIRHRLYTLASDNSNDLLLHFSGLQYQMYGNLNSKALCVNDNFHLARDLVMSFCYDKRRSYEFTEQWSGIAERNISKYNKLSISKEPVILEVFAERMTKGIDRKNWAIIPTVQSFEEHLVDGHRALTVIADYNKRFLVT